MRTEAAVASCAVAIRVPVAKRLMPLAVLILMYIVMLISNARTQCTIVLLDGTLRNATRSNVGDRVSKRVIIHVQSEVDMWTR